MAKKKKAKDYQISQEPVLFGLALTFLKNNNGISRTDFPDKFIAYLKDNGFLRPDDSKLRGDLGLSRETEKAIEVTVRNLYSSHDTLFKTGQVVEKAGAFYLTATTSTAPGQTAAIKKPDVIVRSSAMENLIYYGPPGTGKTYLAKRQNAGAKVTLIQFHSSYTYEHFVQGERLVSIGDQRTTQIIDGPLMICYRRATDTPVKTKVCGRIETGKDEVELIFPTGLLSRYEIRDEGDLLLSFEPGDDDAFVQPTSLFGASAKFKKTSLPEHLSFTNGDFLEVEFKSEDWINKSMQLLIIDEINRADASRVFGELMTALADIDDHGNAQPIALQYSGEDFRWPENLRIIGTMNSADRSIGEIDQAMKRRFKIVACPPNIGLLKNEEIKKIRMHLDEIANGIDLAKLKKKLKVDLKVDRATCDMIVTFYTQVVAASTGESKYLIPIPSVSLQNLHDVLNENKDSIFAIKRKLIGHSFHMEIAQIVAEKAARSVESGEFTENGVTEACAKDLFQIYSDFIDQEIKPQISSICLENDVLIDEIMDAWTKRDKDSLKAPGVKAINDKAS